MNKDGNDWSFIQMIKWIRYTEPYDTSLTRWNKCERNRIENFFPCGQDWIKFLFIQQLVKQLTIYNQ